MIHELDLEARKGKYGCSDLATLHGMNPFKDLHGLWAQTMDGLVEAPTKRQKQGKYFEEAILLTARDETEIQFQPLFNETLTHPEFPKYHLIGSPDGLAPDEEEGGIECKKVGWDQRFLWGSPYDAYPVVPPHYELQVRGYMAITRRPRWRIAAWMGDQLSIYTLERDLEFEGLILDGAERVWRRYFEGGERPPIGGSEFSTLWLKQKFPTHKRPDLRPATDEEIALLTDYGKLRKDWKALKARRDEMENRLREAVGEREGLEWPHGRFTWRKTKDSTEVDWQSMAIALRTHFIKDADTREKVTLDHTLPKPGYRKIYFRSDECLEEEESAHAA